VFGNIERQTFFETNDMELYQIRSFIEVAATKNLTRAAEKLHISQSALSTQIQALEQSLDTPLFCRRAKGMALTPEGESLLLYARKVIHSADALVCKAIELKQCGAGTLKIGINTDPGLLRISEISTRFSAQMPETRTIFVEIQSSDALDMLHKRQLDAGFMFGKIQDPSVFSLCISMVPVCAAIPVSLAGADPQMSIEELSVLPWLWSSHQCPFHEEFGAILKSRGIEIIPVADAVDEDIIKELVKAGTGVGLMREDEGLDLERSGHALVWKGIRMQIPLNIVCLEQRRKEKSIRFFLDFIPGLEKETKKKDKRRQADPTNND
jgi:DNA-binding transcriptional LysR family regulator